MLELGEGRRREHQANQEKRDVGNRQTDAACAAAAEQRSPRGGAEADEHVNEHLEGQKEARLDRTCDGSRAGDEQQNDPGPPNSSKGAASFWEQHASDRQEDERVLEKRDKDRAIAEI